MIGALERVDAGRSTTTLAEARLTQAAQRAAEGVGEPPSLAEEWAALADREREEVLAAFRGYDWPRLLGDWRIWARPTQLAPEDHDWTVWLILAGRGWGKTRTGGEWLKAEIESGRARSIGIVAPTYDDAWDQMVYGTEDAPGVVRLFDWMPEAVRPVVNRNDKKIYFHTGAVAKVFSAEKPEIRGPNTDHWWCDELAKWKYLRVAWDNIQMTNRAVGVRPPRICVTTTPRPLEIITELLNDEDVRVTFGSTFANKANLHPKFLARMRKLFGGSRIGRQELEGLVLGDNPDGLFMQSWINASRWERAGAPKLVRVVVGVDPAVSQRSDLVGIVVCGLGEDEEVYVLADYTGAHYDRDADGLKAWHTDTPKHHTPEEWGELVLRAREEWNADAIVVERNKAGDLVASNVRACAREYARKRARPGAAYAASLKIEEVYAMGEKAQRAEPVSTLCQQGALHFVGHHPRLEREITEWNPKMQRESPNGLDAMAWAVYSLAKIGPAAPEAEREPDAALAATNRRWSQPSRFATPL